MNTLITISDIKEFKELTANVNFAKEVQPHVIEAQEFEIVPLIGMPFFIAIEDDFISSPSLQNYSDLFNGCEYTCNGQTYRHQGLKAVIIYHAYARYLANANQTSTAFGFVQKVSQNSEPISEASIARKVKQARSGAAEFENRLIHYLNAKSSLYPLWKGTNRKKYRNGIKINRIG